MKSIKHLGFLFGLLGSVTVSAQSTLNSAGGSQVVAGMIHSWSVGEMAVVNTATAGNITVTHGVQQPVSGPTAISDAALPGLFEVFPNPATDAVQFRYQFPKAGTLACTLLDATGKTVWSKRYATATGNGTETIPLQALAAGTYLLQVQLTDAARKISGTTYTIQKIQ